MLFFLAKLVVPVAIYCAAGWYFFYTPGCVSDLNTRQTGLSDRFFNDVYAVRMVRGLGARSDTSVAAALPSYIVGKPSGCDVTALVTSDDVLVVRCIGTGYSERWVVNAIGADGWAEVEVAVTTDTSIRVEMLEVLR